MSAYIDFLLNLIIFTFGTAVLVMWIVLIGATVVELFDLVVGNSSKKDDSDV